MFKKHSIINGFHTHHFLTFAQTFPIKHLQNLKMFTGLLYVNIIIIYYKLQLINQRDSALCTNRPLTK